MLVSVQQTISSQSVLETSKLGLSGRDSTRLDLSNFSAVNFCPERVLL